MAYYLLFILPAFLISLFAQVLVSSTFSKYSQVPTEHGLTGAEAARKILDMNNLQHIQIVRIQGKMTDYYDPKNAMICLSDSTYGRASVAAVGVAAHECGHAIQKSVNYLPMKIREASVPICNFGSGLAFPLLFCGLIFQIAGLMWAGIFLFSFATIFQLITLPVEFNASGRAMRTLSSSGMVTAQESKGVKKVLLAAGLTYVAALLTSISQLLYYISMARRR